MGGFINDLKSTWSELRQEKIQNAIDIEPKTMESVLAAKDGLRTYISSGSATKGN